MLFFRKKKNLILYSENKNNSEKKAQKFKGKSIYVDTFEEIRNFSDFEELFKADSLGEAIMSSVDNAKFIGVSQRAYIDASTSTYRIREEALFTTLDLLKRVVSLTKRCKEIDKEILLTVAFLLGEGKNNNITEDSFESECSLNDGTMLKYKLNLQENHLAIEKFFYNFSTKLLEKRAVDCERTRGMLKIRTEKKQATSFDNISLSKEYLTQNTNFETRDLIKEIDINPCGVAVRSKEIETRNEYIKDEDGVYKLDENRTYPFSNFTETEEIFRVNNEVSISHTVIENLFSSEEKDSFEDGRPHFESYGMGSTTDTRTELTCRGYIENIKESKFKEIIGLDLEERKTKFAWITRDYFSGPFFS